MSKNIATEISVKNQTRSLKAVFDRLDMVSYQCSLATLFLKHTVFEIFDFKNTVTLKSVSEIYGDFGRKSQKFPTLFYFASPLKGFPWNWVPGLGVKKTRMMGLPGRQRSLTISSAVCIQYNNVTDKRTDGQTPGHRKDRAYASRRTVINLKQSCFISVLFQMFLPLQMYCVPYHCKFGRYF